ncbi:MAG: GNAT family N-acetyltransferase [Pseudomonadota bacterium]
METTETVIVRPFCREDVPQLYAFMRALAEFEGYIDRFRVAEKDLIKHGLGKRRKFASYVAVNPHEPTVLLGMAVTYAVGWTYEMRPTIVLKELYVRAQSRGMGIGKRLMAEVRREAKVLGAAKVCWTVLHGNSAAEAFYREIGGEPDVNWNNWIMSL